MGSEAQFFPHQSTYVLRPDPSAFVLRRQIGVLRGESWQQDGVSTQESPAISTQVLHERDLLDYNRFRLLHASIAMSEPNRKEEHKPAAGRKKDPASTVQINAAKHTLKIPPAQINAAK